MKWLIMYSVLAMLLAGCGGGNKFVQEKDTVINVDFIIAGQSNANRPNWVYFENASGFKTVNIAKGGYSIDRLITEYKPFNSEFKPTGIVFIHGESDAIAKTDPTYYTKRVEFYRKMISDDVGVDLQMYISTVGYYTWKPELDIYFDNIREAVKNEAKINSKWVIFYDDAKYFRDWGLLEEIDGIHFKREGCELLMNSLFNVLF